MAFKVDSSKTLPKIAASAVGAARAVVFSASSADQVVPAASSMPEAQEPAGLTVATAASAGNPVAVQYGGVGKAQAAASVGFGALVGVASPNGALGPIGASAGAFVVGRSQSAADETEIFSVLLRVRKVGA